MQTLFTFCVIIYVLMYATEAVIRYGLFFIGMDQAILLRDLLLILPLALLFVTQSIRGRVHPAFAVFVAVIAVHGTVAALNLRTHLPVLYGAKLLVNVLFGFIAARPLVQPGRRTITILIVVWLVTLVGVGLDKFVYTFPWMGLETHIGGIKVDVSRGWDIDDMVEKRAAGFTRSSISAAMLLPVLASILAPRIRSFLLRAAMLTLTIAGVLLTTQKGSVVAIAAVAGILCGPKWGRHHLLCAACIGFTLLDVALPPLTNGLMMPSSAGVFSFASFAMRIALTWPEAWRWIANHDVFPFGVGLGGIGGAQRFYAPNDFNPADNLFVYLYASFGFLSLVYLGWLATLGPRLPLRERDDCIAALSVLAFLLGYGAALSILEDQIAALFLGAGAGMLWQSRRLALAESWGDPWRDARSHWPWSIPRVGDVLTSAAAVRP